MQNISTDVSRASATPRVGSSQPIITFVPWYLPNSTLQERFAGSRKSVCHILIVNPLAACYGFVLS